MSMKRSTLIKQGSSREDCWLSKIFWFIRRNVKAKVLEINCRSLRTSTRKRPVTFWRARQDLQFQNVYKESDLDRVLSAMNFFCPPPKFELGESFSWILSTSKVSATVWTQQQLLENMLLCSVYRKRLSWK
ncbi:unnamed protein product [Clavelina lepadiformis]|uniref:Uncharacterized protein n=1 Tax=Clavelina lepadiformis TaxID=159417 RepID=A0ABP0FI43_CLALP